VPPIRLERTVDNVSGLRESARQIQDVREWHPTPFGDVRPALFTRDKRGLASNGKAFKLRERERTRTGNQAINGKAPVRKPSLLKAVELFAQRIDRVRERIFGYLASIKLARQGVASQHALRGVSQGFAGTIEGARVRRDESKTGRKLRGDSEP